MRLATGLVWSVLLIGCVAEVIDESVTISESVQALPREGLDPPLPEPPVLPPEEPIRIVFKHVWCFGPRSGYDPREWLVPPEPTLAPVLHHKFDHPEANRTQRPTPRGVPSRQVTVSSFVSGESDPLEARPGDYAWAKLPDGWYVELGVYWGGSMTRTVPATVRDPAYLEAQGYHLQRDNWGTCGFQHRGFLNMHKGMCPEYPDVPVDDFCSVTCPCASGEGQCRSDDECDATSECGDHNGAEHDLPASFSACEPKCGNGRRDAGEVCDDGDRDGGDGCSATCRVEAGWRCPSWNRCERIPPPPLPPIDPCFRLGKPIPRCSQF